MKKNKKKSSLTFRPKALLTENKYQKLFETSHDCILILEASTGILLDTTNYISKIWGYPKEELLGKKLWNIPLFQNKQETKLFFEKVEHEKYYYKEPMPLLTKGGRSIEAAIEGHSITGFQTDLMRCTLRDITDRIETQRALKESEERLQIIFNESKEGIVIADVATMKIVLVNKTICQMLGYTEKELQQRTVCDIHPEEDVEKTMARFEGLAKGELKGAETLATTRKDGSVFYADLAVSPLYIKGKRCLMGSFRDVTERIQLEEKKNQFINTIAHEIRTPLSIIKESFALVLDEISGPINKEQQKILTIAQNNIDRLARLINQILSFQQLESGQKRFYFAQNNINGVIQNIYTTIEPLLHRKKITGKLTLDRRIPSFLFDKDQIEQVLFNLLDNAIKFTDKGTIFIQTKLKKNKKISCVEVTIQDSGRGIKKKSLEAIFNPFVQIEPKVSGTGLGLSIVASIIQAHNGTIEVKSLIHKGSTFSFCLPLKQRTTVNKGSST